MALAVRAWEGYNTGRHNGEGGIARDEEDTDAVSEGIR